ncbi:MAG TPA: hydantoinase/oxoprolinase family protein [Vicinamibacterales bacterium]|nr:hydantoinase/oxoprolinase family protein [Vicinamibacterales bacterium]
MSRRVGIDTGGTFTDFVRLSAEGLAVHKVRSTPQDQSRAILAGLADLDPRGGTTEIVHGSTVATNAVLERKGARVALVTTAGFEDVVVIGRQTRPELYNIFVPPRRPLLRDPTLVFGLAERLDASGALIEPVDEAGLAGLAPALTAGGTEVVAVCLLHSYVNPAHERQVAASLRAAGFVVSASHEILPEYREYERWSTTVVNAYVTPLIDRYLSRLETGLGPGVRFSIMQSNGGSISAGAARAQAVRTVLSGPAAGVVGAQAVARAAGFERIIAFDMGGTSTDVSLVDGRIATTTESRIGDFPVRLPMIDIHTVGAGGGSIARVDTGGALRVGPESAGADPGPACYGTGDELTVTDANLLLGRLDADLFLGGRMTLDVARARRAADRVSRALALPVEEVAEGVVRVANANMERAIRVVSVERGHDPRRFALVAFGGAGGMHACEIARRLKIATVVVPRQAGVLSALGMLVADVTRDYSASVLRPVTELTLRDLERIARPLVVTAARALAAEGFGPARRQVETSVDVRYSGQSFEITLPLTADYRRRFDREHGRLYGYSNPARPTEVVAVRVRAAGLTDKPKLPRRPVRRAFQPVPVARSRATFDGRPHTLASYRWDDLAPGARASGPAVITGGEATVVVPPGARFRVDGFGNVVCES